MLFNPKHSHRSPQERSDWTFVLERTVRRSVCGQGGRVGPQTGNDRHILPCCSVSGVKTTDFIRTLRNSEGGEGIQLILRSRPLRVTWASDVSPGVLIKAGPRPPFQHQELFTPASSSPREQVSVHLPPPLSSLAVAMELRSVTSACRIACLRARSRNVSTAGKYQVTSRRHPTHTQTHQRQINTRLYGHTNTHPHTPSVRGNLV